MTNNKKKRFYICFSVKLRFMEMQKELKWDKVKVLQRKKNESNFAKKLGEECKQAKKIIFFIFKVV